MADKKSITELGSLVAAGGAAASNDRLLAVMPTKLVSVGDDMISGLTFRIRRTEVNASRLTVEWLLSRGQGFCFRETLSVLSQASKIETKSHTVGLMLIVVSCTSKRSLKGSSVN